MSKFIFINIYTWWAFIIEFSHLFIFIFLFGASIFILFNAYFLGFLLIIVYVGAIAVLFLFVCMLINEFCIVINYILNMQDNHTFNCFLKSFREQSKVQFGTTNLMVPFFVVVRDPENCKFVFKFIFYFFLNNPEYFLTIFVFFFFFVIRKLVIIYFIKPFIIDKFFNNTNNSSILTKICEVSILGSSAFVVNYFLHCYCIDYINDQVNNLLEFWFKKNGFTYNYFEVRSTIINSTYSSLSTHVNDGMVCFFSNNLPMICGIGLFAGFVFIGGRYFYKQNKVIERPVCVDLVRAMENPKYKSFEEELRQSSKYSDKEIQEILDLYKLCASPRFTSDQFQEEFAHYEREIKGKLSKPIAELNDFDRVQYSKFPDQEEDDPDKQLQDYLPEEKAFNKAKLEQVIKERNKLYNASNLKAVFQDENHEYHQLIKREVKEFQRYRAFKHSRDGNLACDMIEQKVDPNYYFGEYQDRAKKRIKVKDDYVKLGTSNPRVDDIYQSYSIPNKEIMFRVTDYVYRVKSDAPKCLQSLDMLAFARHVRAKQVNFDLEKLRKAGGYTKPDVIIDCVNNMPKQQQQQG